MAAKLILDERRIAHVAPGSGPDTVEYHERVLRNLEAYVAPDGVGSAKKLGTWVGVGVYVCEDGVYKSSCRCRCMKTVLTHIKRTIRMFTHTCT